MRRALSVLLLLVLVLIASAPAHAQLYVHPPSDCRLADRRYDGGLVMRRYELHALKASGSLAAAELVHRTTHLPRWASAITATVFIGILPHITGGIILRTYPINPMDWAFDLFNASAPVLVWAGSRGGWRSAVGATALEVAGYATLACWASP